MRARITSPRGFFYRDSHLDSLVLKYCRAFPPHKSKRVGEFCKPPLLIHRNKRHQFGIALSSILYYIFNDEGMITKQMHQTASFTHFPLKLSNGPLPRSVQGLLAREASQRTSIYSISPSPLLLIPDLGQESTASRCPDHNESLLLRLYYKSCILRKSMDMSSPTSLLSLRIRI